MQECEPLPLKQNDSTKLDQAAARWCMLVYVVSPVFYTFACEKLCFSLNPAEPSMYYYCMSEDGLLV